MKPLVQLGLSFLLAQGVFTAHQDGAVSGGHSGSVTPGHSAGRPQASIRIGRYGRYDGYGYGGYSDPFYDYGYYRSTDAGGSNVTAVYPPPAPPVITQTARTAHPVIHEYTQREGYGIPPGGNTHPILYLIAFRDSTIRAAMIYWVDDGTLHYLDKDHKEEQAPISSVDDIRRASGPA
jgi:hypothetical protein